MNNYRRFIAAFSAASLMTSLIPSLPAGAETKPTSVLLDVSQFEIYDENLSQLGASHLHDAFTLFDDQDKVPESPDNTSIDSALWEATSRTNWQPNMQADYGSPSFIIDFGANYVITGICFLDTNGTPVWTISDGEPFSWNDVHTMTMDGYNWWRSVKFDDPQPTRYLRFSSDYTDSGVSELAIYGYKVSELSDEQVAETAPKPNNSDQINLTAGGAVGFNAFIDDPMTAIMAAGNVREYHNFSWLIDDQCKVKFTQGSWGDMDSYYTAMKNQNIDIIPCFQGGSSAVYGSSDYPEIPAAEGADTLDPSSYAVHAQAMYQVAARYGHNSDIDMSTINITDAQEAKVGLGLLNALENCNEPNKGWAGKANYFDPYELAAMCSADYDGHEGTIPNAGVKAADPDFKLAVGGLLTTDALFTYLSLMKTWFDYNRSDGKFAVDILNVHVGPDTYNPEDSSFRDKINEIQAWIDENAPGTELWISEYEIPMADCEVEGVDNHDNEDYQLRYAQRVARTNLIALSEGVDRVTKFQLRDEGEGVYYNSGLVTGKGEWKKKPAWYYVSCMTSVLENADFVKDSSDGEVSIYEFKDRITGDTIKCVWSPTNSGKTISSYSLSADNADHAYLTVPSEIAEGTVSELKISGSEVILDVTETPVYITLSNDEKQIINGRSNMIRPQALCISEDRSTEICDLTSAPADSALNQFYRMFDEPDSMPSVIYGDTSGLTSPQTNVNASNITCYVDLDAEYSFTGFAVYDTYGTGNISVYNAYTDELIWSSGLGGYMYRDITLIPDSAPTDRVKIVKKGGDLNELAFYGYASAAEGSETDYDIDKSGFINSLDLVLMRKSIVADEGKFEIADLVALSCIILNK